MNNNLDTRIQHAVIGETNNAGKTTATDDTPLKGEIIFNSTLDNFKVGNGSLQYSALSNFLPSVNDATLTIKQGGTTKGTFTANASTDVEINLDAGGAAQVQSDWNQSDDTQVDYIKNKPATETWTFTTAAGVTVTKYVLIQSLL